MKAITEAQYLAEIERVTCAKPPPGAFTAKDVKGMRPCRARIHLTDEVKRGVLKSGRFKMPNGHWMTYFWMAKRKAG